MPDAVNNFESLCEKIAHFLSIKLSNYLSQGKNNDDNISHSLLSCVVRDSFRLVGSDIWEMEGIQHNYESIMVELTEVTIEIHFHDTAHELAQFFKCESLFLLIIPFFNPFAFSLNDNGLFLSLLRCALQRINEYDKIHTKMDIPCFCEYRDRNDKLYYTGIGISRDGWLLRHYRIHTLEKNDELIRCASRPSMILPNLAISCGFIRRGMYLPIHSLRAVASYVFRFSGSSLDTSLFSGFPTLSLWMSVQQRLTKDIQKQCGSLPFRLYDFLLPLKSIRLREEWKFLPWSTPNLLEQVLHTYSSTTDGSLETPINYTYPTEWRIALGEVSPHTTLSPFTKSIKKQITLLQDFICQTIDQVPYSEISSVYQENTYYGDHVENNVFTDSSLSMNDKKKSHIFDVLYDDDFPPISKVLSQINTFWENDLTPHQIKNQSNQSVYNTIIFEPMKDIRRIYPPHSLLNRFAAGVMFHHTVESVLVDWFNMIFNLGKDISRVLSTNPLSMKGSSSNMSVLSKNSSSHAFSRLSGIHKEHDLREYLITFLNYSDRNFGCTSPLLIQKLILLHFCLTYNAVYSLNNEKFDVGSPNLVNSASKYSSNVLEGKHCRSLCNEAKCQNLDDNVNNDKVNCDYVITDETSLISSGDKSETLWLVISGKPLHKPPLLPSIPVTSDLEAQVLQAVASAGIKKPSHITRSMDLSDSLLRDMRMFLYVNKAHLGYPVTFADFVHWHSPRDFISPGEPETWDSFFPEEFKVKESFSLTEMKEIDVNVFLSTRMQRKDVNKPIVKEEQPWQWLWLQATPLSPVEALQTYFNPEEEARAVLLWLKSEINPETLFHHLIGANISSAIHFLASHPCISEDKMLKRFVKLKINKIFDIWNEFEWVSKMKDGFHVKFPVQSPIEHYNHILGILEEMHLVLLSKVQLDLIFSNSVGSYNKLTETIHPSTEHNKLFPNEINSRTRLDEVKKRLLTLFLSRFLPPQHGLTSEKVPAHNPITTSKDFLIDEWVSFPEEEQKSWLIYLAENNGLKEWHIDQYGCLIVSESTMCDDEQLKPFSHLLLPQNGGGRFIYLSENSLRA